MEAIDGPSTALQFRADDRRSRKGLGDKDFLQNPKLPEKIIFRTGSYVDGR